MRGVTREQGLAWAAARGARVVPLGDRDVRPLKSGGVPLHILKDVDLALAPGEVTAIVGPSGSGKTSLLMVLSGLEQATGGTINVAGTEITGLDEDQLAVFRRNALGILDQAAATVGITPDVRDRRCDLFLQRIEVFKALGDVEGAHLAREALYEFLDGQ